MADDNLPHDPDPLIDRGDGILMRVSDFFQPAHQPTLSLHAIRKLGALMAEDEILTVNAEQFLEAQRTRYMGHSRAELEEELLRRDRIALQEGKALGDRRTEGRLLRELLRGLLAAADMRSLQDVQRGLTGKGGTIEDILEKLGAEPADARQLKLHGTTLGSGETWEEAEERIGKADPNAPDQTFARPDLADGIEKAKQGGDRG